MPKSPRALRPASRAPSLKDDPAEPGSLAIADAVSLLAATLDLTSQITNLEQRRGSWLEWLLSQISADGGFWCWGRGHPLGSDVTPVATIVRGFSQHEWFAAANIGMTPEAQEMYRQPYVPYLQRSDLVCLSR